MTASHFHADVAVVGLGAWGACALWRLAEAGVSVIGIERYGLGNVHGSSYGGTRMFRTACLEHPDLVPMAQRSAQLWRELERRTGVELMVGSGAALIGPPDGAIVGGALAAARTHDLDYRLLDAPRLAAAMPAHADVPAGHVALLEPQAGVVRAEGTIHAAVSRAVDLGARVLTDTRVLAFDSDPHGVTLSTGLSELRVRQVVLCVGPWLDQLVDGLALETIRMPVTWYTPDPADDRFELASMPVFMRELDSGEVLWGHGRLPGSSLVKLGLEDVGVHFERVVVEELDRSIGPADWTACAEQTRRHLPALPDEPVRVSVSPYSQTPDGQFLIGRPRADPRVVIAGGCCSHGFKHSPAVGQLVADLVVGHAPDMRIDFLDPNRFD